MDKSGKHQKVSQETELRQYARRATAAAIFIQRVWRGYRVTKIVALELREEWEKVVKVNQYAELAITATCISSNITQ